MDADKSNKIIRFPHRPRRLATCRSCGTWYRRPPPANCPDCVFWDGQWREYRRNVAAMRGVR